MTDPQYYEKIKNAHYTNFDRDQVPNEIEVVYYTVLNKTSIIESLIETLKNFDVLLQLLKQYHLMFLRFLNVL
mgnify:CR=1 FL=1